MSDSVMDNIIENSREILDGKMVLSSKPRKINVSLTTRCNISCRMCVAKELDWEVPEKTLQEIVDHFPYLERVVWQGGEVFLYKNFKEVLREAVKFPLVIHEITTNGHLLTEEWLELLSKIKVNLNISIDGTTRDVYEYIRRGSKFENIIKNLEMMNARKATGERVMLVTVMKSNYDKLEEVVNFAARYNFNRIILQPVKANHENGENIFCGECSATMERLAWQMTRLRAEAEAQGIIFVESVIPSGYYKSIRSAGQDDAGEPGCDRGIFCLAPWQQLFIEWGGFVYPHCLCLQDGLNEQRKAGNVKNMSLKEIWNGEKMVEYRKKMVEGRYHDICCGECVCGAVPEGMRNMECFREYGAGC